MKFVLAVTVNTFRPKAEHCLISPEPNAGSATCYTCGATVMPLRLSSGKLVHVPHQRTRLALTFEQSELHLAFNSVRFFALGGCVKLPGVPGCILFI
jgi:hypothetical protein